MNPRPTTAKKQNKNEKDKEGEMDTQDERACEAKHTLEGNWPFQIWTA